MGVPKNIKLPVRFPRASRRKAQRPRELIEAATTLFSEKGVIATRMDEIAAKAKVSKGLIYRYFKNKEELFQMVFQENVVPVLEQCERLVEQSEKAAPDLLHELLLYWSRVLDAEATPGIFRLAVSDAFDHSNPVNAHGRELRQRCLVLLEGVISRGIEQGAFRAFDAHLLSHIVLAPIIVRETVVGADNVSRAASGASDHFWRDYLDLIFQGLLTAK